MMGKKEIREAMRIDIVRAEMNIELIGDQMTELRERISSLECSEERKEILKYYYRGYMVELRETEEGRWISEVVFVSEGLSDICLDRASGTSDWAILMIKELIDAALDTKPAFETELRNLLNRHSKESGSDTADYVLARYLLNCLASFDIAVNTRKAGKE